MLQLFLLLVFNWFFLLFFEWSYLFGFICWFIYWFIQVSDLLESLINRPARQLVGKTRWRAGEISKL
jgi:hypothetical protein